jgi:DNA-directed RNA polymerase subunit RPC12/RpoP
MNKYQEALSSILFTLHLRVKPKILGNCEDENLEVLQELVDTYPEYLELKERATPKKPTEIVIEEEYSEIYIVYQCPNCKKELFSSTLINDNKFCRKCGQALDWIEE